MDFFSSIKKNEQDNHSLIISYPINYNSFPYAKNCKFIEINLDENEYIFIPRYWMHWVFTEPYNLSINYFFLSDKIISNNSLLINNIKKNEPFKNKINDKINFSFKDFLKENLDKKFFINFNNNCHIVPVKKPNINNDCFIKFISIRDSFEKKYKDYYKYIGQHVNNEPFLSDIENFIKDFKNITSTYVSYIWINFDKDVNSGLHYDDQDNILINLIGKKKILLGNPIYIKYMYFKNLPQVEVKYD